MTCAMTISCYFLKYQVSRLAHIYGSRHVEMKGKSIILPNVYVRGDFANVRIGRYCHIGNDTIIRPPFTPTINLVNSFQATETIKSKNRSSLSSQEQEQQQQQQQQQQQLSFLPLQIGSYTRIGSQCIIEASSIGSSVTIGDACVIGQRVLIKDCCRIESGTILPEGMVIPPFSVVRGCPGKIVNENYFGGSAGMLPESSAVEIVDESVKLFEEFVEQEKEREGLAQ